MTAVPRVLALLIAIAGVVDPALAVRRSVPLPIDVRLPSPQDPDFSEAVRLRATLVARLGADIALGSSDAPRAVVAIGNADADGPEDAPLFAISIPRPIPSVRIVRASAEHGTDGQQTTVVVGLDAKGMRARTTQVSLWSGSARVGRLEHRWSSDDEVFEANLPYSPATPGLSILRVSVTTPGTAAAEVDVPLLVRTRRFRVFIYEPRPSWAASFVRQAIEAHGMFQTIGATRTSRGVATLTSPSSALSAPPAPLRTPAFLDDVDVVVVSGLDALSAADHEQLTRFVAIRGGALVLLPDAMLPERLGELFRLPRLEELLLERPTTIAAGQTRLLASELLLPRAGEPRVSTLASIGQGATERPAVFAAYRGKGQVVVSGALDAWRFRGASESAFAPFWQAVIAEAAANAVPRLSVDVEPMLAQPGNEVTVRTAVRETEWTKTADGFRLPAVSASLISSSGAATPVRLWPGTAAGEYIARFPAPAEGTYDLRVTAGARNHDAVLAVRDGAATVRPDRAAALAIRAKSSGGAVIESSDAERVVASLSGLERPIAEHRLRPMRSAWWIIPFAGLLSVEWILRRRRGQA